MMDLHHNHETMYWVVESPSDISSRNFSINTNLETSNKDREVKKKRKAGPFQIRNDVHAHRGHGGVGGVYIGRDIRLQSSSPRVPGTFLYPSQK